MTVKKKIAAPKKSGAKKAAIKEDRPDLQTGFNRGPILVIAMAAVAILSVIVFVVNQSRNGTAPNQVQPVAVDQTTTDQQIVQDQEPSSVADNLAVSDLVMSAETQAWLNEFLDSKSVESQVFAEYKPIDVQFEPSVPAYTVKADFSNVTNWSDFKALPKPAQDLLAKNGFAVMAQEHELEFYPIYEANRYDGIPNFVTTDSMLHNYHLLFNYALEKIEQDKFVPILNVLNQSMLAESIKQYELLKGTAWENAAKRNVGFFAVGSKLLNAQVKIPAMIENEVKRELELIEAHEGMNISLVMGATEDYSQYVPRGHYDKTPALKAYFKSMMWYGRMQFPFFQEGKPLADNIYSSILITKALEQDNNLRLWNALFRPISFMVGRSDDVNYPELSPLTAKVYTGSYDLPAMAQNTRAYDDLVDLLKTLPGPSINSMPTDIQPAMTNFRFMGQRYVLDADIFQKLLSRERTMPKGLDIPAAFGSQEAENILEQMGEKKIPGYAEDLAKVQGLVAKIARETWMENLYWGWLNVLRPLLDEAGAGYPSFMRNQAWTRKSLSTFLGSWTELKHDTILYAKQAYAEMGGGPQEPDKDARGYVEPNPVLYARLAGLAQMTREGLKNQGLLDEELEITLKNLEDMAVSLKTISEKELNNQPLNDGEYELIKTYGGQLEIIWWQSLGDQQADTRTSLFDNPASLIADVATDAFNGQVLEEATGNVSAIYVIVPIDGKLRVAKGGVYTHYEFAWDMSDRLTNAKWREMLVSGTPPKLADWMTYFVR